MEGKLFLYSSFTPPRISSSAAFVFDLQRFDGESKTETEYASLTAEQKAEYIYKARDTTTKVDKYFKTAEEATNYAGTGNYSYVALTSYGFNDSTAKAAGYAIKVEVYTDAGEDGKGDGTLTETLYFDNMQKALDGTVHDMVSNANDNTFYTEEDETTRASDQAKYTTQRKATVTLLDDISSTGFRIMGSPNMGGSQNDYKDVHLVINLDGHTYAFTSPIANDVSGDKSKAISINRNRPDSTSYVVINGGNGGTLKVADKTDASIERLIRSYVDLTLNDVTLDGTKLSKAKTGINEATVCHSAGTLKITGSTTFLNQSGLAGNSFYDITGKLGTSRNTFGNYYANGFSIDIDTTGNIPNIALAAWPDSPQSNGKIERYLPLDFSKASLNITNGNIGTIALNKTAVELGGMSRITIGENAKFDTFETVDSASDYVAGSTGIDTIFAVANSNIWNPDSSESNKYNYLLKSDTKAVTLTATGVNQDNEGKVDSVTYATVGTNTNAQIGEILLSASDVASKDKLTSLYGGIGGNGAGLFGVPYDAKLTWGNTANSVETGYNVAYLNYNSGENAVTVKTAANGAILSLAGGTNTGILADTVRDIDASNNNFSVTLKGHASEANTLRGGTGSDSLAGGTGGNFFGYNGGADTISGYVISDKIYDKVSVSSDIDIVTAADSVKVDGGDLVIAFGGANSLRFADKGNVDSEVNGIKIQSGRTTYNYSNRSIADDDSITLTSNYNVATYKVSSYTKGVNAAAVTRDAGIAITGDQNANNIVGSSSKPNTLYGGAGNDTLTGGSGADVFKFTDGKDVIEGFGTVDKADVAADNIVSAKSSRKGLAFTFKNNKNVLTFNADDTGNVAEKIILQDSQEITSNTDDKKETVTSGGFLTQAGFLKTIGTTTSLSTGIETTTSRGFKLFSGTKGTIDLSDTLYGGNIATIDASEAKNSVTLTGDENIKSLTFGANKKKDLFVYGGGSVTINGYEAGKDRLDIAEVGPINAFSVGGGDVAISVTAGTDNVISLKGAANQEVLMRDYGSKNNSFSKFIFARTGVLYNKEKKPTEAIVYSNAGNLTGTEDSIKKIFLQENVAGVSIQSGNNKATLDASAAGTATGEAISLIGGAKSNRFIGSNFADMFVYTGGKDNIQDFDATDKISFDTDKLNDAKISVSKKSIKFKFDSKNALTLKGKNTISGALSVGDTSYTFSKNAYSTDAGTVTLTSEFSGTYKLADGVSTVDGSDVKKNLTYKGTSAAESLVGGLKKTTFKGGGGNDGDTLVGGTGKDIFFYAKGDSGTNEIQKFDFGVGKDKLKIANGTIGEISTLTSDGKTAIQFDMTNGKKGNTNTVGSFKLTSKLKSDGSGEDIDASKVVIKANNTFYWFASGGETIYTNDETTGGAAVAGDLITTTNKVTAREVKDCDIIDLGYSTNLVKTGVAYKVTESFTFTGGKPTKQTT